MHQPAAAAAAAAATAAAWEVKQMKQHCQQHCCSTQQLQALQQLLPAIGSIMIYTKA
jgi:hypothetical protein